MAYNLQDPLFQDLYRTGTSLLSGYDAEDEAARKDQALGGLKQTLGERYARSGLTGSSDELSALTNAAKDFELDWAERKPKQQLTAIAGSLPIANFMRSVNNDVTAEQNRSQTRSDQQSQQDTALIGSLLSSLGLPQWLARELFGSTSTGQNTGQGIVPNALSSAWNWIRNLGASTPSLYSGLTDSTLNELAGVYSPSLPTDIYDWWTWG